MTEHERTAAIEADRIAYEKRHAKKLSARLARYERNKRRGMAAFVERLKHASNGDDLH
jgi:hypothetical protein